MDEPDTTRDPVFKIGDKNRQADSVIKLRGDINVRTYRRLRGALDYTLAGHPARMIVADRAFPPKQKIDAARQESTMSVVEAAGSFEVVSDPGAADCVIEVRGDLDLRILAGLRRALREAIAARPVMLIVDLAEVTSIDASGLAVLAAARRRGLHAGTRLLLQAPTASMVDLLAETGLDRVLPIVPELPRVGRPGHPSLSTHRVRPHRPSR
jgi:anti-anti-sigma factor